jgi:hypothetical protein
MVYRATPLLTRDQIASLVARFGEAAAAADDDDAAIEVMLARAAIELANAATEATDEAAATQPAKLSLVATTEHVTALVDRAVALFEITDKQDTQLARKNAQLAAILAAVQFAAWASALICDPNLLPALAKAIALLERLGKYEFFGALRRRNRLIMAIGIRGALADGGGTDDATARTLATHRWSEIRDAVTADRDAPWPAVSAHDDDNDDDNEWQE